MYYETAYAYYIPQLRAPEKTTEVKQDDKGGEEVNQEKDKNDKKNDVVKDDKISPFEDFLLVTIW